MFRRSYSGSILRMMEHETLEDASSVSVSGIENRRSWPSTFVSQADVDRFPQGENLLLTVMRFRAMEAGGWDNWIARGSLRQSVSGSEVERESLLTSPASHGTGGLMRRSSAPALLPPGPPLAPEFGRKLSWKERAGRTYGPDHYMPFDFVRGAVRKQKSEPLNSDPRVQQQLPGMASSGFSSEAETRTFQFGLCSPCLELRKGDGEALDRACPLVVAARRGLCDGGLAITAAPLSSFSLRGSACSYFFAFRLLEVDDEASRTLSLGFAWDPPASASSLPESAGALPHSLVIGEEPPRAYLDSAELQRLTSWRPVIHVVAGSIVGALLEIQEAAETLLRLVVFQDGVMRDEVRVPRLSRGAWALEGAPYGVVGVSGNVHSLQLLEGDRPPGE